MLKLDEFHSLSNMLDSDALGDECLDFIELHGYLTASIISPVETSFNQLMNEILGEGNENIAPGIKDILEVDVLRLQEQISRELLASEPLELPCEIEVGEDDDNPSDLERWSMAFCEKHLLSEEEWFTVDESAVAELMLPIIAASGLFDEPEINNTRKDEALFISMLEHIPEVVIDLYGLFHNE
ncbi:MAG: YecA family protein [Gammaproteobacteria bacterium]|nr:YecA family protein [Gammaproteobacteria bacterium]